MVPLFFFTAFIYLAGLSEGAEWSYGHHRGPKEWPGVCGTGRFQSPIDLSKSISHPRYFEPLVFFQYEQPANVTIKNNGHTMMLSVQPPCPAQIAGGGLLTPYSLAQVHFHWGSEHTVNGKRYPLEAHFVHYDKKRFSTIQAAVGQEGGLAVLGVLFEESAEPNPSLETLLTSVSSVVAEGSDAKLPDGLRLQQLLPKNTDMFYRYRGSLTTPGCDEGVLWTILTAHSSISKEQVAEFKELKSHAEKMGHNYRPVQPLNERNLYIRVASHGHVSVASHTSLLGAALLLLGARLVA